MAFKLPKTHDPETAGTLMKKIDYHSILWRRIEEMTKAITDGDTVAFINSIQAVELLLASQIKRSKKYQPSYEKLKKEYDEKTKNERDNRKLQAAEVEKNMAWARALIMLIDEFGLMPEEKGVFNEKIEERK